MRKTIAVTLLAVLTALLGGAGPRVEAAVKVGEISPNFTITDRKTGQPVSLYDYRGSIVVLDFFAYWCGPCVSSSPDLEQNVAKYYKQQGGNPSGVPVAILGVNIEQANPAQTDAFVAKSGMERVANDFQRQAWNLYNTANAIPLFVIINGTDQSSSHRQWEVLHSAAGYYGAAYMRQRIDLVKVAPQPPVITGQPRTKTVDYGLSALFGVTATGTGTVNYQWRKNGINIPGATAPNHVISAVARADEGGYSAVVWNSGGSVTSVVATLTVRVTGTPPSITGQPRNKAVELGQATLFGVTASGTEPLRYQWQKDGVDIPGATGPTYPLPVVARSHAGVYQAVVTNPAGEARSVPAWLVVRFPGLGQRVDRVGVGPDGTLTVDLPVEPGVEYELLESPDLRSWTVRERFQATAPVMRRNVGRPSAGSGFLGLRPRGP